MAWLEAVMVYSVRHHVLPIFGLLLINDCIISLELLELRVPAHVPLGTHAQLSCHWQLGPTEVLYSVKWYKDGKEFFRHVPRDEEPRRKFPLPGVDVETFSSTGSNLTLKPAGLETGGRYRCEVSGERPLFPTVSQHADMAIIVLPDHGPLLSGFRSRYRIGDRVQVTCSSGRSQPPTSLGWYINGEPAPPSALHPPTHQKYEDGLQRTSLVLDFKLREQHFTTSALKVKCLATVSSVYWRSNEESASKERSLNDNMPFRTYPEKEMESRADRVLSNRAAGLFSSADEVFTFVCLFSVLY